jgi:hypothetical protein
LWTNAKIHGSLCGFYFNVITSNKLGVILLLFGKIVEVGVCHNYGCCSWLNLRGGKRYLKKKWYFVTKIVLTYFEKKLL